MKDDVTTRRKMQNNKRSSSSRLFVIHHVGSFLLLLPYLFDGDPKDAIILALATPSASSMSINTSHNSTHALSAATYLVT